MGGPGGAADAWRVVFVLRHRTVVAFAVIVWALRE